MSANQPRPLVGVIASLLEVTDKKYTVHATSEHCIDSVERFSSCIPVILPALGGRANFEDLLSRLDGVILTGGRANVEPHHYGGPEFPQDEPIDPARDATVLPLVRASVAAEVPIFGICRGIQEMNVALGGSLHYRVHLVTGKDDHRMPQHGDVTNEEIFELRHHLSLTPGGSFAKLAASAEVPVNSLHGQGIDRLAETLTVEAVSPDGLIEGVRLKNDRTFTVGVQWHAEWEPQKHDLARALFREFGEAAGRRARQRLEADPMLRRASG